MGAVKKGPILYWMSRDQRVNDNWALICAQEQAIIKKEPLIVVFCLQSEFLNALYRNFKFMLEGLKEVEQDLKALDIPFIILQGEPLEKLKNFIEQNEIGALITDFSPLKIKRVWIEELKNRLEISFQEVDAHNIIPCWIASEKKEYAAYTLRSKIKKWLPEFLVEFSNIKKHPHLWKGDYSDNDWKELGNNIIAPKARFKIDWIKPGEAEGKKVLNKFLKNKVKHYNRDRNDPNVDGTSNLSPYLHFGQIASQRVVLEAKKVEKLGGLKGSFYDEIIVRKELSDNFCFYCQDYESTECFHSWAWETLKQHVKDEREHIYSMDEFENAKTHDDLWNAAQFQMVKTGKMHGYLRMYWGKKILEWTETPEEAMKIAIQLNDKYELDGRDPNGYAGIAWSIGGVHDRAWKERNIFGKIRYMSYNGMKRKFNVKKYIENNSNN